MGKPIRPDPARRTEKRGHISSLEDPRETQRLVVVPIVMVARIVMVIVIVVPAMAGARMRHWRRGKPFAARAVGKRQRRSRAPLADALLAPIAYAVREGGLQPRPLRRREDQRRIVDGVERLQLALQDVLRERPARNLPRRSAFRES